MAVTVTHAHVTAVPDDPAYDIGSDEWNADHTVAGLGTAAESDATDFVAVTGDTMTGPLVMTAGTVTADAPVIDATQTWNSGATTFTGIKLSVTDTASASDSRLLDLKVGGSSVAYIDKAGQFTTTYRVNSTTVFLAGIVVLTGATKDTSKATVCAGFSNDADKWFGGRGYLFFDPSDGSTLRAQLTSTATGEVEVNNGTDGTYRDFKLRNLLAGGGNGSYVQTPSMTVANLAAAGTAGAGARAFVTDATATTFLSTVAGGGSNKVPVVSDGTNWLIG